MIRPTVPNPLQRPAASTDSLGLRRGSDPAGPQFFAELASVIRGLSALFWGLPLCLLAFARHFVVLWATLYDLMLPVASATLLLFGATMLGRLHKQERVWQRSVLHTQILALVLVGLAPFLFLWNRAPGVEFYARAVLLLAGVALIFVVALTRALARLAAMLPDETARLDARLFHGLSGCVVAVLAGVAASLYFRLSPATLTEFLSLPRQPFGFFRQALLLLLALVPVAMAMSVAWKLKEVAIAMTLGARVKGA